MHCALPIGARKQHPPWQEILPFLVVILLLCGYGVRARQYAQADTKTPVLRATTRMVQVDVVVKDRSQRPLSDLREEEFELREDGKPQRIAFFSFSSPLIATDKTANSAPVLPDDTYTNRPEYNTHQGPLMILLLDELNGSSQEQSFARQQMLHFLRDQLPLNQKMTVLALTDRLLVLQDFTTNPALLRAAIEKFAPRKPSAYAQGEPLQVTPQFLEAIPPAVRERLLENLQKFNDQGSIRSLEVRARITLQALNAIGRTTAGYSGRKALVWVSAAFPFALLPSGISSSGLSPSYAQEIQRTASLLADAQVAVYPVNVRGLTGLLESEISPRRPPRGLTNPINQVGEAGDELARNEGSVGTMYELANSTGGRAFVNRNDLSSAVLEVLSESSTYYTLSYYPENAHWDGKLRRIQVRVARKGAQIRYRRGYFAVDTRQPRLNSREEDLRAAMESPLAATGVTFLVRVAPQEEAENLKNALVELRVDAQTLALETLGNGERTVDLDLVAVAFSTKGEMIGTKTQHMSVRLPQEQYQDIRNHGLSLKMELEIPTGSRALRVAVRDNHTGLIGTTDVPLSKKDSRRWM